MGVDVVLQRVERRGTSPRRRRLTQVEVVPDGSGLFARICGSVGTPLLNRVDPYGDLVLTTAEMPQFLSEIDAARAVARTDTERRLLADIRALAERCAQDTSTELHLQGD
ncbi:hypothetical protein [Streptomyces sp. NPDC018693]|uniref:hypothetical protein n=1 Tax=unclassified Streptomyces TaxID=2593676 RepID=UPI003789864D